MLHDFLTSNRDELIRRCKAKAAKRFAPATPSSALESGVPLFLRQLTETLRAEQFPAPRVVDEPKPTPTSSDIGRSASIHGTEMLRRGFSVDQVVHDYGDVCQAVTELAVEQDATIAIDEFRTLNRCLDNAIADAVAAFGRGGEIVAGAQADALQANLDEQKRLVDIATQSFFTIRTGSVGLSGATGALLVHTLRELRSLADRMQAVIDLPRPGRARE